MNKVKKNYDITLVKVNSYKSESCYIRSIEIEGYHKVFLNGYSQSINSIDLTEAIKECVIFDRVDEYKKIITPIKEKIINFFNSKANGVGRKTKTFKSRRLIENQGIVN